MSTCTVRLIEALQSPSLWPDQPDEVRVVETHISWVLLTRDSAWKIKKPVRFDFLDFSTLERRKHFCEEELRLNRRTAPDLYLSIVPISGTTAAPEVDGTGEPFEYAIRMHRFDDSRLLSHLAADGLLRPSLIDTLAERVADFHASIPSATMDSPYGRAADIRRDALDNFNTIEQLAVDDAEHEAEIHHLREWTATEADRLVSMFEQRRQAGFVRECHGDLHLGNIVELDDGPRLFDCIEFNAGFRWTDVISEVAFLVMDLEEHGEEQLARRLLNRYLERTGDYAGLHVLRFYLVYRAMVRAKIDMIRLSDDSQPETLRRSLQREFGTYLSVADHDAERSPPALIVTHGVSGSGKSVFAEQIVEHSAAIRIRSDVERKRLFGLDETDRVSGRSAADLYSPETSRRTYDRLAELAATIISAGFPVVVDATFLQPAQRSQFRQLADRLQVPFLIVACSAPEDVLVDRVAQREVIDRDASDAGVAVLRQQLQTDTEIECEPTGQLVTVDTSDDASSVRGLCHVLEFLS
ncbi:MAG: bifunctional aminoglycoside phosphotransferase/ATP-binding protein [Planctomycetota bacterium]|jgi:aminoglycoside phosphotransferase family enzyme/predicted kinase